MKNHSTPAGGDGSSWPMAYRFIQDALAQAAGDPAVTEVRVAEGTYRPDQNEANPDGTESRAATFQLLNGVTLAGGYAGLGAPDPDARDVELFLTTLSGDLLENDVPEDFPGGASYLENSLHITIGEFTDQTAVLDGFEITSGFNNSSFGGAGLAIEVARLVGLS